MSANQLLKGYNVSNTSNIKDKDPLYNPSIPDTNDPKRTNKSLRDLKFKDQYYVQMSIDQQMKNGDGFTLGPNNKYLKKDRDYDRRIDINYFRKENVRNKKYTQPDDFGFGQLSYYNLPRSIPRPQPTIDMSGIITPMNAYQYQQRFLPSAPIVPTVPTVKPVIAKITDKVEIPKAPVKVKPMADKSTIGYDPTDSINKVDNNQPSNNYKQRMEEIERQRQQSKLNANLQSTTKTSYDTETSGLDKYGKPKIINQHKTAPMKTGIKPVGLF